MRTDGDAVEREVALRLAEADVERARQECEDATAAVRAAQGRRAEAIGRYAEATRHRREIARGDA